MTSDMRSIIVEIKPFPPENTHVPRFFDRKKDEIFNLFLDFVGFCMCWVFLGFNFNVSIIQIVKVDTRKCQNEKQKRRR